MQVKNLTQWLNNLGPYQRLGLITVGCILIAAILAFTGVRIAERPVRWIPLAFILFFVLLIAVLIWAYQPVLAKIQSIPKRSAIQAAAVILSFLVYAFLSYTVFLQLCIVFSGNS